MSRPNIVKKLSMRHLVGDVKNFIPTKEMEEKRGDKTVVRAVPDVGGEPAWLANVIGVARGIKSGTSNYGDWEALLGDFIAEPIVGPNAGKRFRTGQLFLPEVVMNMITASLSGNDAVQFTFRIGITAAATDGNRPSNTGYEYTADFLVEPEEGDPLEELANRALPATSV